MKWKLKISFRFYCIDINYKIIKLLSKRKKERMFVYNKQLNVK